MSYELKQSDIFELAQSLTADTKQKGNELFFKYCPYCNGGGHDKETFSINLDNGTFKCFRNGCGKQGHFVEMARDFNFQLIDEKNVKYRKLPQTIPITKDKAIEYMASRGISESVTRKYHVTTEKGNDNNLCFPFYDENNILQFIKLRNMNFRKGIDKAKEWCVKDCKPILFGMAQCKDFEMLVITEGQIDSLSVAECGYTNAVSVPIGCNGFTWIPHCYDWIVKFKKIVVFGDFENGKMSLLETLRLRLPMPVYSVEEKYYLGEKDANDILRKYGKDGIVQAIENSIIEPIKCVKKLSDVKAVDIYSMAKIKTTINEVDRAIGGIYFGQVVLLSGKRGEGKSTFMSQLIADTIEQDYPVFIYSGELPDYHFKRWLDMQIAGSSNIITSTNSFGDENYNLSDNTIQSINNWYSDKAYIFDNNSIDDDEFDGLLKTMEMAICRYGIKLVCIDNLMTALDVDLNLDIYRAQSDFVKKLAAMAKKHEVAIILVAHPKKENIKEGFNNDSVSGSADITNRVDVVMNYERAKEGSDYDSLLSITKNRLTGRLLVGKDHAVKLCYSDMSKRIKSISDSSDKIYGCFENQISAASRTYNSEIPF